MHESLPIISFIPMFMFAILFGLSMDYEVFLLSRIREEYNQSGDNTESVIVGITTTARVITSAALIMISVFLSFVFGGDPTIKMMGVGLATAVFVDATIIRLVLVPATMKLLGNANWWFPKWLDRLAAERRHRGRAVAARAGARRRPAPGSPRAPARLTVNPTTPAFCVAKTVRFDGRRDRERWGGV